MRYAKIFLIFLAAVLLIVAAAGYIIFQKKNPERLLLDDHARKNAGGSFLPLADGITHYEMAGPDTGKLVVLVHGFSVPYYIWDSSFTRLANAGFRVLRYDEFGRGYSDRPDRVYDASLLRRQLADLLAALKIRSVYALAGVSFGGPVISDFVVHNPALVSRLIFIDPLYPDGGEAKLPWSAAIMKYQMAIAPDEVAKGQLMDLKYPARFPGWVEQYKAQMQFKGFRNALVSTRFHYALPDSIRAVYRQLDLLRKPVLLIWGKEDRTLPYRYSDSLRKVLHADFMPVEDAAHLPQMEKAVEVNNAIIAFLKAGR